MRWKGRRQSSNVEDRRRMTGPAVATGGIGVIVMIIIAGLMGVDVRKLPLDLMMNKGQQPAGQKAELNPEDQERAAFVSTILAETEDVWKKLFRSAGKVYQEPKLVLFSGKVQSACGFASAASGPFYCPADSKLYLDTDFFTQLHRQLGAPGDFAQAYVIAHEVGHHVQHLLGQTDYVHRQKGRISEIAYNKLSVRLELQADFYAGVWAHYAGRKSDLLERGDIEEGLRAASAIGDDTLQRRAGGYIRPDAFTHGTSEQRNRWFRRGLETGDLRRSDTFSIPESEL